MPPKNQQSRDKVMLALIETQLIHLVKDVGELRLRLDTGIPAASYTNAISELYDSISPLSHVLGLVLEHRAECDECHRGQMQAPVCTWVAPLPEDIS